MTVITMLSLRRVPLLSRSRPCCPTLLSPYLYRRQTRWLQTIEPPNTHKSSGYSGWSKTSPWIFHPSCAVIFGAACFVTYQTSQPFRHSVLAVVRCSRVAGKCSFLCHTRTKELMYLWLVIQVPPSLARLTTK
jgi:aarF domain-containing kinase